MNGDGQQEAPPRLQKGSGFLELDLDGDSTIKTGNELFGPTSGSGFSDLSIHDMDENDPIFSKLQAWMNASAGQQQLLSLKATYIYKTPAVRCFLFYIFNRSNGRCLMAVLSLCKQYSHLQMRRPIIFSLFLSPAPNQGLRGQIYQRERHRRTSGPELLFHCHIFSRR